MSYTLPRHPSRALLSIILSLTLLTSCTLGVTEPDTPIAPIVQTGSVQSEARIGKVKAQYLSSDGYTDIRDRYEKSGYLSGMIDIIDSLIVLPRDLPMSFDTCGEDNAFYDPNDRSITLCYEIVKMLEDKFGSDTK